MHRLRRLIAWAFYFGFLAAVGIVVFLYVRQTPRCTIAGHLAPWPLYLAPDGSRMATMPWSRDRGPLQVWDLHTGALLREMLGGVQVKSFDGSPDGRHIACCGRAAPGRLLNWLTGEDWPIPESGNRDVQFSRTGRWLFADSVHGKARLIVDVAQRRVALRLAGVFLAFNSDERLAFVYSVTAPEIEIWDIAAANKVGTIARDLIKNLRSSPDGKTLATWVRGERADRQEQERQGMRIPDRAIELWSLPTGELRFRKDFPPSVFRHVQFAPNSMTLATWSLSGRASGLELLDAKDGRKLWEAPIGGGMGGNFSPDGTLFCYYQGDEPKQTLRMCDAVTGKILWERPGWGNFAGDTGILYSRATADESLVFLDARTGAIKAAEPDDFNSGNSGPILTRDDRHFVIDGWQVRRREARFWEKWFDNLWPDWFGDKLPCSLVLESATGRELFRVVNRGTEQTTLSDDGSTLVTVDAVDTEPRTMVMRVWDVRPGRAYAWSAGSVVGLMLALFILSRSLRGWRKPGNPVPSKP